MEEISICWLRRDLRLVDHAALYHALRSEYPVLILFIFDREILDKLVDPADARVTFIYQSLLKLQDSIQQHKASLLVKHGSTDEVWTEILTFYKVAAVYTNHDYEPYARKRDERVAQLLQSKKIAFHSFKDQVIFEKAEVLKANNTPYTIFTPYYRQWVAKLKKEGLASYPSERYLSKLLPSASLGQIVFPSLNDLGFQDADVNFPSISFAKKLADYDKKRDCPAADATTRLGIHLRFGTISIREVVREALIQQADKWLSELAWREFYMMILWHFPYIVNRAFKPAYDQIEWRNNEKEFEAWCAGNTGYPIVDAGMRQLNATGFMHNRVRMVVASFLCKHLLIDWRWGEAYFAAKLLDYEQASNVGGWQWACGCGNDAAPYFRIFNPELQLKKFDPKMEYVFKWAPAYQHALAPVPIVSHAFARDRALMVFKKALA